MTNWETNKILVNKSISQYKDLILIGDNVWFVWEEIETPSLPPLTDHPLNMYYMKFDDLSLNVRIKFKWLGWGICFFGTILDEIKDNCWGDYSPINFNFIFSSELLPHNENILKGLLQNQNHKDMELWVDAFKIEGMGDTSACIENSLPLAKIQLPGGIANLECRIKLKLTLLDYIFLRELMVPSLLFN